MFLKFLWVNSEMEYEFGEEAKNSTNRANCISLKNLSVGPSGSMHTLLPNLTRP